MANVPIHSMTDLWNSGGTTYYGIKMDVTNSASAAGSKLFAMQIASVNIFDIDKSGDVTITSVDAGAAVGPVLALNRFSSTPAASDVIGIIRFDGRDSAANAQTYADIYATITDPTSTSEDASLSFRNVVAGTLTVQAQITATGWNSMNIGATTPGTGAFTTLSATGAVSLTTALTVANGGTGAATFTAGLLVGNGTSALISRVLTGTAAEITVTNGTGVAGNPTLSLPTAMTMTGKTLTGGTYAGAAFNGTLGATTPAAAAVTTLAASGQVTLGNYAVKDVATDEMRVSGGTLTDGTDGAMLRLFGGSRAGFENDIFLQVGADAVYQYDHSALSHVFRTGATARATITATGLNDTAIGATTPNTGAFTTLATSGTVTFNSTGTTGPTITSTDAGAGNGPIFTLFRDSASPAASDIIGIIRYDGNDATAAQTTYVDMYTTITDTTNGSEDATFSIRNIVAGTLTVQAQITATGWNSMDIGATTRGTGAFTTLAANSTVTFTNGGSMTGTWSNLGTVTTVDINGGTVDGAVIGGASAAAGTFTTATATTANITTGNITTANFGTFSTTGATRGIQIVDGANMWRSSVATAVASAHLLFYNTNGNVGSIQTDTNSTLYNTTSDYRLPWKEGRIEVQNSGAFIDALKPYYFPKAGKSGFVAHEFAEVSPRSVTGEKDAVDADGAPVMQTMQASADDVMANIVAELKSLRARVAELEAA